MRSSVTKVFPDARTQLLDNMVTLERTHVANTGSASTLDMNMDLNKRGD